MVNVTADVGASVAAVTIKHLNDMQQDSPPGGAHYNGHVYDNGQVAPVAEDFDSGERTKTGIPLSLLWIPYVLFSMIVVGLMLMSFIRYHKKHGHKYRQRQKDLWHQLNLQTNKLLDNVSNLPGHLPSHLPGHLMPGDTRPPPNGGVTTMDLEASTSSKSLPNHSSSSHQSLHHHHHHHHNPKHVNTSSSTSKLPQVHVHQPLLTTVAERKKPSRKRRKPISFKSNVNGSMVDLRVGDTDTQKMYKTSFLLGMDNQIWTSSSPLYPPSQSPPPLSESEEEDIMLIQQTNV